MILDLLSLVASYAVGSCRDVGTSLHVVAIAGGVLVYVVIHIVVFTLDHHKEEGKAKEMKRNRKLLLLFAILVATITYQAGLTPPGGFWAEDDAQSGHAAGFAVLASNYPRRYTAFFYSNAVSYMASVAIIILLVNPNLYVLGIKCHALYLCAVGGLFGLMGAYAAGSSRHTRTSIFVIALVAAVSTFVILMLLLVEMCGHNNNGDSNTTHTHHQSVGNQNGDSTLQEPEGQNHLNGDIRPQQGSQGENRNGENTPPPQEPEGQNRNGHITPQQGSEGENQLNGGIIPQEGEAALKKAKKQYTTRKYLMLVGILVASVTYQAGLTPPGGVWPDSIDGHAAGDPVLRDSNKSRYRFFFYSNSVSFLASAVVILLLLLDEPLFAYPISKPAPQTNNSTPEGDRFSWRKLGLTTKEMLRVAQFSIILALFCLLFAYACGCSREWVTSGYVIALAFAVVILIAIHVLLFCDKSPSKGSASGDTRCTCNCHARAAEVGNGQGN